MELLLTEVKEAPCFVISFDESFNEELKKKQMDLIVRYFKNGKVESRYLCSGFLGHRTAEDLKRTFEECIEKLDTKKTHSSVYGWTKCQLENVRPNGRRQKFK